jgi:hypothetical protein
MTKPNKANQKPKPTIQINRNRGGGKKRPDLFANIRNLEHPLDNMFPNEQVLSLSDFPFDSLDSQDSNSRISKSKEAGYPTDGGLDIQKLKVGYPNQETSDSQANSFGYLATENLDSQNDSIGYPKQNILAIQSEITGYPNSETLDSQIKNIGNPKTETLDSLIAKDESRISKKTKNLDIQISKDDNLDIQIEEKKTDWKKYEVKRLAKGVFLRTNDDLTKRFKQFCIGKDWDFSYGTELAWNKLMTDLDIQTSSDLDSLIALDNRRLIMMFKTKPFIINLYLAYNSVFNEISDAKTKGKWSVRWTPRDDEAAFRFNDVEPQIIELGIIQTQMNKGFGQSKIQTFKYYLDEIEKVLTSGISEEMLTTILEYHRQLWKNTTKKEVDLSFLVNNNEI